MNRALIVSSSADIAETAENYLRTGGYGKIAVISSGSEARRFITSKPEADIVVINTPLPDEFGSELAAMIAESTSAGIILICGNDFAEYISENVSDKNTFVILKPLNREIFIECVKTIENLKPVEQHKESSDILSRIDEMRLINRAKCTLMQNLKFTEPQAHKYIEKQAMNNRQTRKEVALKILASYGS